MRNFTRKLGAPKPTISVVLLNGSVPMDLTSATSVYFIASEPGSTSPKINRQMTIVSPATSGAVEVNLSTTDVDTLGEYLVEYKITWPGGEPQRVPEVGYDHLRVIRNLGG
jgi:hypothetical protein